MLIELGQRKQKLGNGKQTLDYEKLDFGQQKTENEKQTCNNEKPAYEREIGHIFENEKPNMNKEKKPVQCKTDIGPVKQELDNGKLILDLDIGL